MTMPDRHDPDPQEPPEWAKQLAAEGRQGGLKLMLFASVPTVLVLGALALASRIFPGLESIPKAVGAVLALPFIIFYFGLLQVVFGPRLATLLQPKGGQASGWFVMLIVLPFGMLVFAAVAFVVVATSRR